VASSARESRNNGDDSGRGERPPTESTVRQRNDPATKRRTTGNDLDRGGDWILSGNVTVNAAAADQLST